MLLTLPLMSIKNTKLEELYQKNLTYSTNFIPMDSSDSCAWVFDSLVGFLHGPVWNIPLQTFIEEKSLPFEPSDSGEVIDKPEYKKIHEDYRNLVDVMLGSFMDDIGITAEQFESACQMSARDLAGLPAHFHRRLFEQIWAANDYEIFVKMMTHKNVELQLQALELIERRFGMMPNIFSSEGDDTESARSDDSGEWSDKDDVMKELKKLQLEELHQEVEMTVPPEEVVAVVAEKKTLLSKLQSFEKDNEKMSAEQKKTQVVQSERAESPGVVVVVEKKKQPAPALPSPKKVEVSEEEIQARQQYLKQQRDKLLALKKQVRERRLGAAESDAECGGGEGEAKMKSARPRSARMAAAAMAGSTPAPPPDAMQLRRALATKLKTEVVDTNH